LGNEALGSAFFEALAEAVAERVVKKLTAETAAWTDQTRSPLGRKRHCLAVRRRVDQGEGGAAVVGRKHLLSKDALASELNALSTRKRPSRAKPVDDDIAPMLARYGVRRTG